jgi:acetylornithine deacetylase/succinyl-diaminopimelate desuccinylase-like protein
MLARQHNARVVTQTFTLFAMANALVNDTVDLLQTMIRNACVNDGTVESGQEVRNVDVLRSYLEGCGADIEQFEPLPGRASLVARLEGNDPDAPTVCLMGHTDVVPVTPDGWSRDPFGGELVDGEIWGRGAIDMLNLTASMAVATRAFAATGRRPRGSLVYLAVADEEAGSRHGAQWLIENHWDAIGADYVITESGGIAMHTADGLRITCTVAEKGTAWRRLRLRGAPGHGSMPYRSGNVLVKLAEVIDRLGAYRPTPVITDAWRRFAAAYDLPADVVSRLIDPDTIDDALANLPDTGIARYAHACTHTTFSPNVVHGGVKTNVIPDLVDLDIDIRTLPGETAEDVEEHLRACLGDLFHDVEILELTSGSATASPTATPLWDALERTVRVPYPGAQLIPRMTVGGTDARLFRAKGVTSYGFGLFADGMTYGDFSSRFHGNNERIDVESLALTTLLWQDLVADFVA